MLLKTFDIIKKFDIILINVLKSTEYMHIHITRVGGPNTYNFLIMEFIAANVEHKMVFVDQYCAIRKES